MVHRTDIAGSSMGQVGSGNDATCCRSAPFCILLYALSVSYSRAKDRCPLHMAAACSIHALTFRPLTL